MEEGWGWVLGLRDSTLNIQVIVWVVMVAYAGLECKTSTMVMVCSICCICRLAVHVHLY